MHILFQQKISLYSYLHENSSPIRSDEKLTLARNLAVGLYLLHTQHRPPAHSHLSSRNVMLSPSDLQLLISDYGLCSLKKFCKLFIQYTSVNAWSAPELWSAENSTNETDAFENTKADSYSFGVILWEIETGQVPFEGYDERAIKNLIVIEKMRPKIHEQTEANLARLIRRCWHENP